ncbi:hypothetical protein SDC9_104285 [bioreactor metagenome]|uniref:Uncharacterized protein n=1 Tax=bioreactor metagenome TaxID=1076179 RepID=A0A645B2R8_9ZZZZ
MRKPDKVAPKFLRERQISLHSGCVQRAAQAEIFFVHADPAYSNRSVIQKNAAFADPYTAESRFDCNSFNQGLRFERIELRAVRAPVFQFRGALQREHGGGKFPACRGNELLFGERSLPVLEAYTAELRAAGKHCLAVKLPAFRRNPQAHAVLLRQPLQLNAFGDSSVNVPPGF